MMSKLGLYSWILHLSHSFEAQCVCWKQWMVMHVR